MLKPVAMLFAGAMMVGAAGVATAQNLTPNLDLPPNAYLPPVDATPYGWAFPSEAGRSAFTPRSNRLIERYRGYEQGGE